MITIRNIIDGPLGEHDYYAARPGPLGNPFVIGKHGTRTEVIEKYLQLLNQEVAKENGPIYKELEKLAVRALTEDLCLVCHCSPLRCHAEIIKDYLICRVEQIRPKPLPSAPPTTPAYQAIPHPEDDSPESVIQRTGDRTYFCAEPLPNEWADIITDLCNAAYREGRADAERDIFGHADAIAHAEAAGLCSMPVPTRYGIGRKDENGGYGMLGGPYETERAALNDAIPVNDGDCLLRLGADGRTTVLWTMSNNRWVK